MKYIYILYSDNIQKAYIGSTSLNLKRRLCFHKNDNRRNYGLSCSEILNQKDYKIDKIISFDEMSKPNLEKIESQFIQKYKNGIYSFNNKLYNIVNKQNPYKNKRYMCSCGCEKELIKKTIRKHLKNINNSNE